MVAGGLKMLSGTQAASAAAAEGREKLEVRLQGG